MVHLVLNANRFDSISLKFCKLTVFIICPHFYMFGSPNLFIEPRHRQAAFIGFLTGVGTSLPELSAGLAGARRRQSDLVLGNVLGSNIFNSLGVAGTAAILGPGALTEVDVPIIILMLVACLLAGIFAYTGRERISRIEGLALLAYFFAYAALIY